MRRFTSLFAIGLAVIVSSCTTIVTSKRVAENSFARGIRYRLPQPFLLVTPKADGLQVQRLMLPDLGAEYTLDIQSYMSAYKSDVQLNNGMLQKVTLDLDNTKVAADVVGAAGELAKAKVEQIGTAAAAEQTAKTQLDTQRQKLEFQIESKKLDIRGLEQSQPVNQTALDQARRELQQLELKLDFLLRTGNPSAVSNVGNTTSGQLARYLSQPGAVLYKVVQTPHSVRLVRVMRQPFVQTVKLGGEPTPVKRPTLELGAVPSTIKAGETLKLPVKKAPDGFAVSGAELRSGNAAPQALGKPSFKDDIIIISIPPTTNPSTDYKLDIIWSAKDNPKPADSPVSLSLTVTQP